jgi:transmembrane 9 superfamily protein 2/4
MARNLLRCLAAASAAAGVSGFYLPGIAPHDYEPGERVWLKVNSLTSSKTQVPYEYYKFNFCKPKRIIDNKENFAEFMAGDRIQNSPYQVFTMEDTYCNLLCAVKTGSEKGHKYKQMKALVEDAYHHNWLMDSLPAASVADAEEGGLASYAKGVPVGYVGPTGKVFVYNHVQLIVKYHETDAGARIVGLYAEPYSVRHKFAAGVDYAYGPSGRKVNKDLGAAAIKTCTGYPMTKTDATFAGPQELTPDAQIIYTYDVVWEPSEVAWASRWDIYLNTGDQTVENVHWFSIVNAVIIVLTLGAILAVILARSLRADLTRYNKEELAPLAGGGGGGGDDGGDDLDETGWKVVHADVYRPPHYPGFLCALVATGAQLGVMAFLVLLFARVRRRPNERLG